MSWYDEFQRSYEGIMRVRAYGAIYRTLARKFKERIGGLPLSKQRDEILKMPIDAVARLSGSDLGCDSKTFLEIGDWVRRATHGHVGGADEIEAKNDDFVCPHCGKEIPDVKSA